MKVEHIYEVKHKNAFSRKMYCPFCGAHEYEIVEQLKPFTERPWFINCPQCGGCSPDSPAKDIAIMRWKELGGKVC